MPNSKIVISLTLLPTQPLSQLPRHQIKKEAEERDAMMRMSELYTKNPALGDAGSLVHRLAENQKNLDGLQAELTKFQVGIFFWWGGGRILGIFLRMASGFPVNIK